MRWIPTCTAALLLPVLLVAQDGKPQEPTAQAPTAQSVYDKLSAELLKQNSDYRAASKAVQSSDAYKEARAAKDTKKIGELMADVKRPDLVALGKEAIAAAAQFEGDGAVKLLGWAAVQSRDTDLIKQVVATLSEHHIQSAALEELLEKGSAISRPLGAEAADAFLSKVIQESPHNACKAWALYWKSMAYTGRGADEDKQAAGAEMLAQAEQLAEGHWLADKIRGPRFAEEKLQIGLVAPNIEGEDIDGVKFELQDYRGKVVVLDFWGFW